MADKKSGNTGASEDFDRYLSACPEVEDGTSDVLRVTGGVLRSKKPEYFALQAADTSIHEIPRDAVESFAPIGTAAGTRIAELTLRRGALGTDLAQKLGQLAGAFKLPNEKAPLDTLKEIGGDTLKEQPLDTLKEIGGGETLKEQPLDTLKEIGGGETLKEPPFDTLKEIGGGDTLKEQPLDTLKEIGGGDTVKEQPFDTLKEVGEGTGVVDTLVEGFAGTPNLGVVPPELQLAQGRAVGAPGAMTAAPLSSPQLKNVTFDTTKEVTLEHTIKELIGDKYIKEIVKEIPKEVAWDGTGAADTLVEGRPDWGAIGNPVVNPGSFALAVPFVLATPHQAPQGAVAQQMLAAQALQGRLGY